MASCCCSVHGYFYNRLSAGELGGIPCGKKWTDKQHNDRNVRRQPQSVQNGNDWNVPRDGCRRALSNTILTFDLILRFSISHQKKRFCRKPLNIIEFMIEILIFSFVSLEFLLDHEEAAKHTSYELSTLLQILYSLRVFRIFRLIESCSETKMLKISLLKSKTEFLLFVTVLISFAFIFGSWIYWAELLNPQTFPTIFTGIWWAIVTMTTVGYGDFTPKSTLGYFVGVLTSIFGLILLAMPIATIASNFSKIYDCYNFRKSHLKAKRAKQSNQLFYHRKAAMVL